MGESVPCSSIYEYWEQGKGGGSETMPYWGRARQGAPARMPYMGGKRECQKPCPREAGKGRRWQFFFSGAF